MIEPTAVRPMGTMHNGQIHGVTADNGIGLEVVGYDTRPHPERLEHVIAELAQRIEALEKTIRDWSGD